MLSNLDICTEINEVDDELTKLTNKDELIHKINYLKEYMGIVRTHAYGGSTLKEEYHILIQAFLDGDWRVKNARQFK